MLVIKCLTVLLASFLGQALLRTVCYHFDLFLDREAEADGRKIHTDVTPRIGGIGIFLGLLLILPFLPRTGVLVILCAVPVFLVGLIGDYTEDLPTDVRMVLLSISPVLGIIFLDLLITDIGFLSFPLWVAMPFTIFAVLGITNAINIIDGTNGLSSGLVLIGSGLLGLAAYLHGDVLLFHLTLFIGAGVVGFFLWNYPSGSVFLGDGGAYLLGFLLSGLSILLVTRNPAVSPWFPVVALAYPIVETLFSIYRRKLKKEPAMKADRFHFHMLIYHRITRRNATTALFVWTPSLLFGATGLLLRKSDLGLAVLFGVYVIGYIICYREIVRMNGLPRILRKCNYALESTFRQIGLF